MTAKRFMNKMFGCNLVRKEIKEVFSLMVTCGRNTDLPIKIEEAQFYLFLSTTAN